MARTHRLSYLAVLLWPLSLGAQTPPQLANILERLDRLERENRTLSEEVRALRAEVAASRGAAEPQDAVTVEEKLGIQQQRIEELDQTKVESSQRFPIRLTGMALFNAFSNSKQNGGNDYPTVAPAPGAGRAGATLRQTIVGLDFRGPAAVWGGQVHGSVYMDFFAGAAQTMRLRTGSMQIDWKTRSVMAGLEKPIFNPREPSSLAQVGISPLTGAGNLWLWLPQVRVEQDFSWGAASGLRARMGVVQTREVGPYPGSESAGNVEAARPGWEGRFEFFHNLDDQRRFEIAPGFHASTTHAGGFSVPSNLFSLDWFFNPWSRWEFTGVFYAGQNVAHLGTGAIRQGYAIYSRQAEPVHSRGGWGQFTFHAARRLDLHLFSGLHDDADQDLIAGGIGKNHMFGANLYYRLAPNVLIGLETSQVRTYYLGQGIRINNHYDLALGYLF